jgi:hypothetical protein
MRYLKVTIVQSGKLKRLILIPEIWVMGYCQSHKCLPQDAIEYWIEQEQMEEEYNARQ